jgi:uncharacterized protein (TIGR04141 family)
VPALTIYRIQEYFGGKAVTDLDDVIDFENWGDRITGQINTPESGDLPGRLYIVHGNSHPPDWLRFLQDGLDHDIDVNNVAAPGALLVVRTRYRRKDVYFAFSFGVGRFLLKDTAYVRNFGLRVALNAIFEGDTGSEAFDPSRLRSVTSRRPSANTLRLRGQASRSAALEAFDVDLNRDLLNGVTGQPVSDETWGFRVTGTNALNISMPIEFSDLRQLCKRMCDAHSGSDYKARFSWIDDISRVEDPAEKGRLENQVVDLLRAGIIDELVLSVPEFVEWHRVQDFVLPYEKGQKISRPELRLQDYLTALENAGKLDELDLAMLLRNRVVVLDGDKHQAYQWSVWRCLSGELLVDGQTYVMDDGEFYVVSRDYLAELNGFITKNVPATKLTLPDALSQWDEGEYNKHAGKVAELLCMDRRTVRVAQRSTTPVEVCDLLSTSRHLVHVKRKLGSSTLSHLFSQGYVSAELLLTNLEFRVGAAQRIRQAIGDRGADHTALGGDVDYFGDTPIDAAQFEITFAIVADWGKAKLADRLPFFSKVNLRRTVDDLQSRRFKVTHARVQTKTF